MSSLAVITARGGSKRIPRKNIKDFCGKPIIAYTIMATLESDIFDEVMVSTDDEEIAEVALKYGAKVPFLRSAENSDDFKNSTDAVIEVIKEYRKLGKEFSVVAQVYPTAPFMTPEDLRNGMKIFTETGADSLIPVTKFGYPPQRGFIIAENRVKFLQPEYTFSRSQDLEPIYHDIGQFYFAKTDIFMEKRTFITDNIATVVVPEERVQDIDNESDWKLAEVKYKYLVLGQSLSQLK